MCLNRQYRSDKRRREIEKLTFPLQAWKVMRINRETKQILRGLYGVTKKYSYKRGTNFDSVSTFIWNGAGKNYESGYHCFLDEKDAVRLRENVAVRWGFNTQDAYSQIVVVPVTIKQKKSIKVMGEDCTGTIGEIRNIHARVVVTKEFHLTKYRYKKIVDKEQWE